MVLIIKKGGGANLTVAAPEENTQGGVSTAPSFPNVAVAPLQEPDCFILLQHCSLYSSFHKSTITVIIMLHAYLINIILFVFFFVRLVFLGLTTYAIEVVTIYI